MKALIAATLIVRLYNTAGIPAPELAAARDTAAVILADTGLSVVFRMCGVCEERLQPGEVVVRVLNAPVFHPTLHPDAYGVTYVVRETDRGWLATVFADRIAAAAERVDVQTGTVLGRVMAHEVGHLLLGVGYHGDAGVMRADWPDGRLTRGAEEWRFSRMEAATMHDRARGF